MSHNKHIKEEIKLPDWITISELERETKIPGLSYKLRGKWGWSATDLGILHAYLMNTATEAIRTTAIKIDTTKNKLFNNE